MKQIWFLVLALAPSLGWAARPRLVRCESALVELRVSNSRPSPGRLDALATPFGEELPKVVRHARKLLDKSLRPLDFRISLDLDAGTTDLQLSKLRNAHFTVDLFAFEHPSLTYLPGYAYGYGLQVIHEAMTARSNLYQFAHEILPRTPEHERLLLLARVCRETYAWMFTDVLFGSSEVMTESTTSSRGNTARALSGFAIAVEHTALRDHTLTKRAALAAALQTLAEYWEQTAAMMEMSPRPWVQTKRKIDFLEGTAHSLELPFGNHDLTREFRRIAFSRGRVFTRGKSFSMDGEPAKPDERIDGLTLVRETVGDPGGTEHLEVDFAIEAKTKWGRTVRLPLVHEGRGLEEYKVIPAAREMAGWFGIKTGSIGADGRATFEGKTAAGERVRHQFQN